MLEFLKGRGKNRQPPSPPEGGGADAPTSEKALARLSKNADLCVRQVQVAGNPKLCVTLVYMDGMVNSKTIGDDVIKPLMTEERLYDAADEEELAQLIEHGFVYFPTIQKRTSLSKTLDDIIGGSCAIFFDSAQLALTFETKGFMQRSISEPTEENIVKGPKDVFVETIRVNTATVRRKIKSPDLVIEQTIVGERTKTPIAIVYLEGLADDSLLREVKSRLDKICVDGVLEAGYIEEYIVDKKFLAFPQVIATERPDVFAMNILDGRVGILIDGVPVAYNVPCMLYQFLRTPDDYSQNYLIVSLVRILRYALMLVTLFLPAFYVSITSFHHEMIPSALALSIANSKEGVPYPAFLEIMFMLIAFEILLESGLRLPKNIGQAVSIVGALVVGEAAVSAKFISPAVVVIIAITAISGFTMPNQAFANALRVCRFLMVVLSSILGLIGMTFGAIFLLFHLAALETFGTPYLAPYVSSEGRDWQDSIVRAPLPDIKNRPSGVKPKDIKRQK